MYHIESRDIRFESVLAGIRAPGETFEEVAKICESCVLVEATTVPGQCIPCVANPCNLICRCKQGRKAGICYHILFVTHMIMKDDPNPDNQKRTYNLNYMNSKVAGARRDGKKGKPKRIKNCLLNEDSSDEDDAQLALTW